MNRKPNRRRRLYYFPGMISLVVLPLLCLWKLEKHEAFRELRVLRVSLWDPSKVDFSELAMTIDLRYVAHSDKQFRERPAQRFTLTANEQLNRQVLAASRVAVRKLFLSKDTTRTIHFFLADSANYENLVRVVEICKTEANVFVLDGNDIWMFNPKPPVKLKNAFNRPILMCGLIPEDPSRLRENLLQKDREKAIAQKVETAKAYAPSIGLLLLMAALTIRRRRRELKIP